MAVLNYAAANTSSLRHRHRHFTTGTLNPRKPILLISCFSTSFPSKPTKRINHLRQKFLKTLTKPIDPKLPPANPIIPIDSPPLKQNQDPQTIEDIQESDKTENLEVQKLDELKDVVVEVPKGVSFDKNVGTVAQHSILKYGLWLVGAFLFQTVCAVWFFGNKNEVLNGNEKNSVHEVDGNGNGKLEFGSGALGSDYYVDDLEMEMKIEEIRVMAREAREKERLESKNSDFDSEDSNETDEGKYSKSVIEEEVDNRLIKLRKKLENARGKSPVASVGYSKKDQLDDGDGKEALLFKKKYKYKELSDSKEKPKGFIGLDDNNIDKPKVSGKLGDESFRSGNGDSDAVGLGEGEKQSEPSDVNPMVSDAVHVVEKDEKKVATKRGARKQGKGKGGSKTKGIELEKNNGRSNADSLKGKGIKADVWWSNLPYVLAILMRRGENGEGGEGLYTLKSISSTNERISHMVAFEDRVDATNFCYLLQSFFEDLEDFKADVVPLTVKELNEAVKSMSVIVVRRGQLRLYAGQPLAEAETALRAMIKQG